MAEKTLNTRIILKHDELAAWEKSSIVLKEGEIALAKVNTPKPDGMGGTYTVPTYLMKVGDNKSTFNQLNWVAATAADVYDWAKQAELPVEVTGSGDAIVNVAWDAAQNKIIATRGGSFDVKGAAATAESNAKGYTDAQIANAITGNGSIDKAIDAKINALNVDKVTAGQGQVIRSVEQANGKVTAVADNLVAADIPSLEHTKISDFDNAVAAKASTMGFASNSDLTTHTENKANPHGVTKAQVGLDKVENKSPAEIKTEFTGSITSKDTGFVKGGDVHTALSAKLDSASLKVTDGVAVANQFVTAVSESGGNFTITRRGLAAADIPDLTASKITDFDTKVSNNADVSSLKTTVGSDSSGLVKDVNTLKGQIGGVTGAMHFKGVKPSLPENTSGYADGDVILVGTKEYVASGDDFVELGDTTQEGKDITAIQAQLKGITSGDNAVQNAITAAVNDLANGAVKTNTNAIAELKDGTTPAKKAETAVTAGSATKATQDGNGKVIADTYETKADANSSHNAITRRLDVIEAESGVGSIKQALADAKSYADGLAGNYDVKGTGAAEAGKVLGKPSDKADANTVYGAKAAAKTNADAIDAINNSSTGILAKAKEYTNDQAKNYATSAQGEKANSALQKITTTENQGLKVTNKNHIDIDDAVTFVLDCGTSAV